MNHEEWCRKANDETLISKEENGFPRWAGLHFHAGGEWPAFRERYVSIVLRMPANHAPTHSSLVRQARFAHEINAPIRFSFGSLCGMTTFP